MTWLRRIGRHRAPPSPPPAPVENESKAVEGAAPGAAALLDGLEEDGSHAVLDLGRAADASLRLYGRFASRIRFADLLGDGRPRADAVPAAALIRALPPQPDRPYDLVFAWDVLDRLLPEDRPRLVERLVEVTAPDARLHAVVRSSEDATTRPLRFTLIDVDRMRYEPAGPVRPGRQKLLPADVVKLLAPFRVVHAFTLKAGLREYVAVRGP